MTNQAFVLLACWRVPKSWFMLCAFSKLWTRFWTWSAQMVIVVVTWTVNSNPNCRGTPGSSPAIFANRDSKRHMMCRAVIRSNVCKHKVQRKQVRVKEEVLSFF